MLNLFSSLIGLIGLLLIVGGAVFGLLVVLLITTARLPADNPLRRILHALCLRLSAMLGTGAVAVIAQPIPGLDLACDLAVPAALIYLSITMFREIAAVLRDARQRAPAPVRIEMRATNGTDRPAARAGQLSEHGRAAPPGLHD